MFGLFPATRANSLLFFQCQVRPYRSGSPATIRACVRVFVCVCARARVRACVCVCVWQAVTSLVALALSLAASVDTAGEPA